MYLLENLLMDYIALLSANCFLRRRKNSVRLFFTALLASVGSLFLTLSLSDAFARAIGIHFVLNTVMIFVGFGRCGKKEFLENWAVMYLAVLLAGGIMEWLQENQGTAGTFLLHALITSVLMTGVNIYLNRRQQFANHLFWVQLENNGVKKELTAYWDSGNQLYDPYTGKPVCILQKELAEELIGKTVTDFSCIIGIRYIPFRSLGETNGLLAVCDIEHLQIFTGEKELEIPKAVIGLADGALFEKKEYKMILHASMQL